MAQLVSVPPKKLWVVFFDVSASARDRKLFKKGMKHLSPALERSTAVGVSPALLLPGEDIEKTSEWNFLRADLYVPFITPDFANTRTCRPRLDSASARAAQGKGLVVLPCLLLQTQYELLLKPHLFIYPANRKPIGAEDEAWQGLAAQLCERLQNLPNYAAMARRHEAPTEDGQGNLLKPSMILAKEVSRKP